MKLKKLIAGGIVAALTCGILGILGATNLGSSWQEKLSTNLYQEREISDDIVIVYIDDNSLSDNGLGRWQDWSRDYYATVIENLSSAAVIGLDIIYTNSSSGISGDQLEKIITDNFFTTDLIWDDLIPYISSEHPADMALAEAITESGNIFLVKYPYRDESGEIIMEVSSLDMFTEGSAGEGFAHLEIPQSENVLQTEGDFAEQIAEYFTGEDLTPTRDDEGLMYINYAGESLSYDQLSFADIYDGNFDTSDVAGKIVLIGNGSPILQDHYSTPIDETTNMYGVEIHANTIQTILDGAYLRNTTTTERLAILAVISIIATALFMYLGIWWTIGALIVLGTGYWFSAEAAFRKGIILDLVYPYIALIVTYLAAMLYRYFTEIQASKELKSAFGHYVSPEVVEEIAKNPDTLKLGGDKRPLTVFFADIKDFTTWSEGAQPEDLVTQLNEYFSALSEIIMKHQGTVDKFEGDAIMAFWGAPLHVENHAELTCQAAIEARSRLTDLNKKWTSEGKREISFRIGINTGEAVVGNLGSAERFDYTAIGDNVNLAARLESANKFYETTIMVSENTHGLLKDKFATRRLDRIRVKGKEKPIDIFELISHRDGLADGADKFIDEFHQAIEYYRNGKFQEAHDRFTEIATKAPNDGPTKTYLARITDLLQNPPENWDGTWTFTNK